MQKTYFEEKDSIWFPSMIRLFHWWITSAVNLDQVQFNQENDFFARDLEFSNQTFLRSMSKESLGHTLGTLPPHMISKKSKKWQMWLMIFDLWYMIFKYMTYNSLYLTCDIWYLFCWPEEKQADTTVVFPEFWFTDHFFSSCDDAATTFFNYFYLIFYI